MAARNWCCYHNRYEDASRFDKHLGDSCDVAIDRELTSEDSISEDHAYYEDDLEDDMEDLLCEELGINPDGVEFGDEFRDDDFDDDETLLDLEIDNNEDDFEGRFDD